MAGRVALSFDDGPSPHTREIADLVAAGGGRATFFVLGGAVAGSEGLLRDMAAAGHELGNHTWSHPHCGTLAEAELLDELRRTQAAITAAAGVAPRLVRPPYGEDAERVGRVAAGIGLGCALWAIDPRDWRDRSGERIARHVLARLQDGAVVDLHDGWPAQHRGLRDRSATVAAVRIIMPELRGRGYEAVTLSAMSEQVAIQASPSS